MYLKYISKKIKILLAAFTISICGYFLSIHYFMSTYTYSIDKETITPVNQRLIKLVNKHKTYANEYAEKNNRPNLQCDEYINIKKDIEQLNLKYAEYVTYQTNILHSLSEVEKLCDLSKVEKTDLDTNNKESYIGKNKNLIKSIDVKINEIEQIVNFPIEGNENISYLAYIAMRIFEISLTFLVWIILIAMNITYYNKYDERNFFIRLHLTITMFGLITFVSVKSEVNKFFVISWFVYIILMLYYVWKEDNISQKKKKSQSQ